MIGSGAPQEIAAGDPQEDQAPDGIASPCPFRFLAEPVHPFQTRPPKKGGGPLFESGIELERGPKDTDKTIEIRSPA